LLGPDLALRVVAARVLAIAPERRAVVAYDTAGARGPGPRLIAKVYAEPGRAARLHAVLGRLEALGLDAPRPVAHLPELGACVFTAVEGRTLDRLDAAGRLAAVAAVAGWLSRLHRSPLELDRTLDLDRERAALHTWTGQVVARHPAAAAPARRLLEHLIEGARTLRPSAAAPIHKDLHHQHCLVDAGRLVVIDLDEMRAGDPAFDVAHFAANLRLLELREGGRGGGPGALETAFLDAHAAQTGRRPGAAHRWFHAYTCLKIGGQLARGRGPAPVPLGRELERQLALILDEGMR
ncbi:MAG TPA: phosphotransferase, partial [Candidatus Dormibacteraeota bacterium]